MDVAHASVRRIPDTWKLVWVGERFERADDLPGLRIALDAS